MPTLAWTSELTYGDFDRLSRALGAWLQSKGLAAGERVAVMMPNILQNPVCIIGILRAGYVVVNVNPLYTPRELEHQLKDSGARAIIVLENFARTLQQVIAKTSVIHVVVASMGDLLGFPKGAIVNLVVRRLKKMVPPYSLPAATKFNDAIAAGKGMTLEDRTSSPTMPRSCSTRGAPPASPRAQRCSIATSSPTCSQNEALAAARA